MAYPCALDEIDRPGLYLVRFLDDEVGEGRLTVMQMDADADWWAIGSQEYGPGHQWSAEVLAKVSIPRDEEILPAGFIG